MDCFTFMWVVIYIMMDSTLYWSIDIDGFIMMAICTDIFTHFWLVFYAGLFRY